jgi:hypothetical protein
MREAANKNLFHRIEQAVGGSRVIACDVGVDARQVLPDDSRMTLNPQGFMSLDAAFLTRSFQSGSSVENGPLMRSANTRGARMLPGGFFTIFVDKAVRHQRSIPSFLRVFFGG